jgi:hypothetical protein
MRGSGWVRDLQSSNYYKVDRCSQKIREGYRHKRRANACGAQRFQNGKAVCHSIPLLSGAEGGCLEFE